MLLEFFRFDLRYQLKQPLLWVSGLVLAAFAFGATAFDAVQIGGAIGNVNRNAPSVVIQFMGIFSMLSMFIVGVFIAGAVLRDSEVGMSDLIFSTPMKKHQYLFGRFAAGLTACLSIFVLIAFGMMLGSAMPWIDPARLGPFPLSAYGFALGVLVIPNLIFIGAMLMLLAATTRSILQVYVGVLIFFVLFIVAGALTRDINNEWLAVLLDPFGVRAISRTLRYWAAADLNSRLPELNGYLLANRILWTAVGLTLLGATLLLFKPQREGTGRKLFGRTQTQVVEVASSSRAAFRRVAPNGQAGWQQCWRIFVFDTLGVLKSVPFLVMLLFAGMNFSVSLWMGNKFFGVEVYPVTRQVLESMQGSFNFMLFIIVMFYAGELIWKERQAKIADVVDAMPLPDWAPLMAKFGAMLAVVLAFLLAGSVTGMLAQLAKGYTQLEPFLYIKGLLLISVPFALLGMLALALQVLLNNKYLGYFAVIVFIVAVIASSSLNFDHNLYRYGSLPSTPYSDINGFGHLLNSWAWFALYWGLAGLMLLQLSRAFWVRGVSMEWRHRLALAAQRMRGGPKLVLALTALSWGGVGGWIFYNTNVLNPYLPKDIYMDRQAEYERRYARYAKLVQPKISEIRSKVEIFPQQRSVLIDGHYQLVNRSQQPISELHLQQDPDIEMRYSGLPAHQVVKDDRDYGYRIIKLNQPLQPGASLGMDFQVKVEPKGFTNDNAIGKIHGNGTFFNNMDYYPSLGFQDRLRLPDRHERKKRGLGELERAAKLEDRSAYGNHELGDDADWLKFEIEVVTDADQIALAPGYLQKEWQENGRRHFRYAMDQPMLNFFSVQSARWQVKKGDWQGIPIEVYHHPQHHYNVDRMIEASKKSLDYFSQQFRPYQHKQLRILEFPGYANFAQSFANTVPYSENIGFIADLRDKDEIDYVFFVVAHEVAHQWWGHQVVAANVQGASMLIESLAQYSALMVMEKEYGRDKMRRFLKYELDRYLSSRSGELLEELPLYKVENQQYLHYRKGAMVFYRLRDEIGEEALNRALKRFAERYAFAAAPYPTTLDLLKEIRAEAPAEKQAIITDLFEKIVFYDNRVLEAKAKQRKDGQWEVSMKLKLDKREADGVGKETPRPYDEAVEIGVFSRPKGGKEQDEKVLLLEKRQLAGGESSLTLLVKDKPFEVGVDPYNKLIDRVSRDNRKEVSFD